MLGRQSIARFSGIALNTEMWREFKGIVQEAAAETVDDEVEKELVVKVWGKLVSQVIGEMKNGILMEARDQWEWPIEPNRGRAITLASGERISLLPAHFDRRVSKSVMNLSQL